MWKLSGHPKTQRITHNHAKQFSEMEAAPQDRPLRENRMRVYEKIVKDGGFRPCSWAAVACKETGITYRVNGKHTSTLFTTMNPLPELYAIVEYYVCDTLHDVSRLYSTYDSKQQSRNIADINKSFAGCVPQLENIHERIVNATISGIWFHRHQEQYVNIIPQERAEAILEHWDFAVWASEFIGKDTRHLLRVPVFAAMYGSYAKSKKAATEFWWAVANETGTSPNDPDRKLARFLMLHSSTKSRAIKRVRVKDREFYVKAIHAWNAWRNKESTNLNYHQNAGIPEIK